MNHMLTRKQADILATIIKAGNAAQFVVRDGRSMVPFRALRSVGVRWTWTGCVVSCWIGRCQFVWAASGSGYEHEENPCESREILPYRNHDRAMARLNKKAATQ